MVCLGFIVIVYTSGVFAPWIAPYSYTEQRLDEVKRPPTLAHPFGTDELGRDLFSRVVWGARSAAVVSLVSVGLATVFGVALGALAGYAGHWIEAVIMRATDILFAFPGTLLTLFVAATIKPSVLEWVRGLESLTGWKGLARSGLVDYMVVFGCLSIVAWPGMARLVRGQVLALRNEQFIEAASCLGASTGRIVLRHVLPNAMGPVIVAVSMGLGGAVLSESVLSYLGVGIQPPNASWGVMIWEGRDLWRTAPHLVFVPGAVIALIILSFALLGDSLNDALNPRLK
jgi:ABC-type dipeptide/oligopeptide/nickel transport system permease subunit